MTLDIAQNSVFSRFQIQKTTAKDKIHAEKLRLLKSDIEDSQIKIRVAQENFNNVTEPKLIDFYIYKIQAEQSRFSQLLCEYRKEEQFFSLATSD